MLVLTDGRLALLDFGSVGWLSPKSRNSLINLFLALVSEDYDALVDEYLELSPSEGQSHSSHTRDALARDVSFVMTPYYGIPLKDIPAAKLLLEASQVAFRHHVRLPPDLIAVFKSNMILEGIGRTLDPDFDLLQSAVRFSKKVLREKIQPQHIIRSLLRSSKDIQRFVRKAPRLGLEIMRQLEAGQIEVKLKSSEWERLVELEQNKHRKQNISTLFLGSSLLLGFLLNATNLQQMWILWLCEIIVLASGAFLVLGLFRKN